MLSFLVTDPTVDKNRLMKMCLVHDLAESVVGDITPHDGVSKEEKRQLEEVSLTFTALNCFLTASHIPSELSVVLLATWLTLRSATRSCSCGWSMKSAAVGRQSWPRNWTSSR